MLVCENERLIFLQSEKSDSLNVWKAVYTVFCMDEFMMEKINLLGGIFDRSIVLFSGGEKCEILFKF